MKTKTTVIPDLIGNLYNKFWISRFREMTTNQQKTRLSASFLTGYITGVSTKYNLICVNVLYHKLSISQIKTNKKRVDPTGIEPANQISQIKSHTSDGPTSFTLAKIARFVTWIPSASWRIAGMTMLFFFLFSSPVFAGEMANQFTISIWVNPSSSIATKALVIKDTEVRLVTDSSGNPSCAIYASGTWQTAITSSVALSLNTWTHVTCTYDKATIKVYVNGVQTGSGAQTNALNDAATVLLVGQDDGGTYGNLIGTTDQLQIYNYARTTQQIVQDMNAGHPPPGSPVGSALGHWKFDEGFGTTANNAGNQGSALNGTMTGMSSPATATSGWTQSGKFGRALIFDGSNDYVEVSNTLSSIGTGSFTTTTWFKSPSGGVAWKKIMQTGCYGYTDGFFIARWNATSQLAFAACKSSDAALSFVPVTTSNYFDDAWHHVAFVVDRTTATARVYVDGANVTIAKNDAGECGTISSDSKSINISSCTTATIQGGNLRFGVNSSAGEQYDGSIDESKIYNYALTADQVKIDMNQGQAQVLGALSDNSSYQKQAANQEYCIPGDSTSCVAPVGRWDFEENTGSTVNDKSGNANTGTWAGTLGSQWKPGKVGIGGNFDGSTNYITVADSTSNSLTGNFTLSAWIKTNSASTQQGIIEKYDLTSINGYILRLTSAGKLSAYSVDGSSNTGVTGSTTITTGVWTYVTAVYDGATIKVFLNGVQDGSAADTRNPTNGSDPLKIGGRGNDTLFTFNGQIDQARVYNYARTPAQIAWDYNRGAPVGHWKFNECQGSVANDSSGNVNTGTITVGGSGTYTSIGTCAASSASTMWYNGATGKYNSSLAFDGTDDQVVVSNSSSVDLTNNKLTLSAWVKWSGGGSQNYIIDKNSNKYNLAIGAAGAGRVRFYVGGTALDSPTAISSGVWHHLVGTNDGSTNRLYIDGIQVNSNSVTPNITAGGNLIIGCYATCNSTYSFDGQIDDVGIYNYALTATQVKQVMNQGAAIRYGPVTGAP